MNARRASSVGTPAPTREASRAPRRPSGRRARRPRFGPVVLVVMGAIAMVAGLGAGSVVTGHPVTDIGDPPLGEVLAADPADGSDADPTTDTDGLSAVENRRELPMPPTASPALAELLADDLLGPDGLTLGDRRAGLLSTAVPASATGSLVVVPGSEPAPHPERTVRTVRVEYEQGLDIDGAVFAQFVMAALNDPRGWGGDGSMSFARTDGSAQIRVVIATPNKVDAMCAPLNTRSIYSCGRNGHAAINHTRWVQATDEFTDFTQYRQYVVNHEVGHLLGRQHVSCPGSGQLAPIMQQQSIRVAPCLPNAWPFPDAA